MTGINREIGIDLGKEGNAKFLKFVLSDPRNIEKFIGRRWILARHVAERDIGKNDVGGHTMFVGDTATEFA